MLYPGSGRPLFEQLYDALLRKIERGEYAHGDSLPSERQLCEEYGVSRVTVRQALGELSRYGLILRKQGKGNFVASRQMAFKADSLLGFVEEFSVKNMDCNVEVVRQGYTHAPEEVSEAIRIPLGTAVFQLVRRILVDVDAHGVDYSYIPQIVAQPLEKLNFGQELLYRTLEQRGCRLNIADQTIMAGLPTAEECALLDVPTDAPMLIRRRIAYVEGGFPIVYSRTVYRGDRYHYSFQLNRYAVQGGRTNGWDRNHMEMKADKG